MAVNANPCQSTGCKNQARKGQKLCRACNDEQSKPQFQMQPKTLASCPQKPIQNPAAVLTVDIQAKLDVIMVKIKRADLEKLQAENQQLRVENSRMGQFEEERLRYERESRDAWNEIDRLKKVNDELREDNERLRSHLAKMEAKVETLEEQVASLNTIVCDLKSDPILLEIAQLFHDLELIVVEKIRVDEDDLYLSDINLSSNADEVKKSEQDFGLKRKDLLALKAIISAIRKPRKTVAHPNFNFANFIQWKTALHDYCPEISKQSIVNLLKTAEKLFSSRAQ